MAIVKTETSHCLICMTGKHPLENVCLLPSKYLSLKKVQRHAPSRILCWFKYISLHTNKCHMGCNSMFLTLAPYHAFIFTSGSILLALEPSPLSDRLFEINVNM